MNNLELSRQIATLAFANELDSNFNVDIAKSLGTIYSSIIFLSGMVEVSEIRDSDFVARLSKLLAKQLIETNDLFLEFVKKREDPSLN